MIDLREKDMSRGEFNSVKQAVSGIDSMINENAKDKDVITLMKYLSDSDKEEKLIENQQVIKTPIVRNGRQATIGFCPDVWKNWE